MSLELDSQTCVICGSLQQGVFTQRLMNRYDVRFFRCLSCEFLNSADPTWLAEAYANPLAQSDTGLLARAIDHSTIVSGLLALFTTPTAKILDYGGGYGLITRALRDIGHDCRWYDRYAENIFARGFEADATTVEHFDAIVSLEVIEHLRDPFRELGDVIAKKAPDVLIISTILYGHSPPPPDWWYYGFEHGQHISFFNARTMKELASRLGFVYSACGIGFHVFSRKPPSIAARLLLRTPRLVKAAHPLLKRAYSSKTASDHLQLK